MRVSNGLDPDQERRFVCPDLGPNCLQRFSADDPSRQLTKYVENPSCRMTESAQDYVLNVTDVNVKLQDTSILHDVTFTATSGNILAIMGPTGK